MIYKLNDIDTEVVSILEDFNIVQEKKRSDIPIDIHLKTICQMIADNCIVITKNDKTVIVYFTSKHVVVTTPDVFVNDEPMILLASSNSTQQQNYEKWLHVIGKMCKKPYKSKYFSDIHRDEHLKNGTFNKNEIPDILRESLEMIELYHYYG